LPVAFLNIRTLFAQQAAGVTLEAVHQIRYGNPWRLQQLNLIILVLRAGHARLACEVSGEVMPPAAGTRRGDSLMGCSLKWMQPEVDAA